MFKDLLNEIRGFKYQITLSFVKQIQKNTDKEFATVCFNSTAKTVIDLKSSLNNSFQEVLYIIDNWINKGSAWINESISGAYINISIFSPLSGSTYIELPDKLRKPKKDLINIKNSDNKYFLWCNIRHLNPIKKFWKNNKSR